jgi:hypothetical protein
VLYGLCIQIYVCLGLGFGDLERSGTVNMLGYKLVAVCVLYGLCIQIYVYLDLGFGDLERSGIVIMLALLTLYS